MQMVPFDPDQRQWTLTRSRLLAGLPDAAIHDLERACDWFRCTAGDLVLGAAEKLDGVYFIAEGIVRICHRLEGKREVNFAQFGPGDAFGELSAIDGKGKMADAIAVSAAVIAICPQPVFRNMLIAHPPLALRLLEKLAEIIRQSDQRIANLAALTGPQRVYAELLRLAIPDLEHPGRYVIDPAPYHRDIAAWAGTTTDVVARAFGHLMKSGLMQRQASSLFLHDRDRINVMTRILDEDDGTS